MEQIITTVSMAARFLAVLGGALVAVFVVYAGILWITSAGDPQKVAMARNALLGCVVGAVIIGMSVFIPGVISRWIIEPSGGLAVDDIVSVDCDRLLREQLVYQRNADDAGKMQDLVHKVQLRHEDTCSRDQWSPEISPDNGFPDGCYDGVEGSIGGVFLPDSFYTSGRVLPTGGVGSGRHGPHLLVIFKEDTHDLDRQPADGSICWFYHGDFEGWASGYFDP